MGAPAALFIVSWRDRGAMLFVTREFGHLFGVMNSLFTSGGSEATAATGQ